MSRFAHRIILASALVCALVTAVAAKSREASAAATCPPVPEAQYTVRSADAVVCVFQGIAESRAPMAVLRKVVEAECTDDVALPAFAVTILKTLAGPTGFGLNIQHLKDLKNQLGAVKHWYSTHPIRGSTAAIEHLGNAGNHLTQAIMRLETEDAAIKGAAQSVQSQDCGGLKRQLTAEGEKFGEYFDLTSSASEELDQIAAPTHPS